MKVLSLRCGQAHAFEGWFGSEADFQSQLAGGLLSCPVCADAQVVKMPSAPRLNLHAQAKCTAPSVQDGRGDADALADGSTSPERPMPAAAGVDWARLPAEMQGAVLRVMRDLVQRTEDVGPRFPDQARRMHHGELEARPIRGQANAGELRALLDEGIEVIAMPALAGLNETLQ